jgi:hypothetical protein
LAVGHHRGQQRAVIVECLDFTIKHGVFWCCREYVLQQMTAICSGPAGDHGDGQSDANADHGVAKLCAKVMTQPLVKLGALQTVIEQQAGALEFDLLHLQLTVMVI